MNAAVFSGSLAIIVSIMVAIALIVLCVGVWRYIHSKKKD
ncbi:Uncharacterised protein [Arcanobacterium haemolyticum]|uniref:Uncharacterized protein n=1 Tax=Arcanobacterium haemolyticum (strain ATCC 9345 / DSM 20595 / CCM 5947 / CCUG 17215 / LMG 16163 / NBRC 15585 / NCTC 8452 / 11018) TaxID=644284 RepID=D7BMW9_ARCHD|nr:hypothetical protein Arch_0525 [Arcanobacterium haemolyticum DSM 20595]SPT75107.1 Uncharacterised protein [Arcanobacterium haemolyticum]SQH29013.1 Uncharacterised protein [Arcanobacterium haemolyticum]